MQFYKIVYSIQYTAQYACSTLAFYLLLQGAKAISLRRQGRLLKNCIRKQILQNMTLKRV